MIDYSEWLSRQIPKTPEFQNGPLVLDLFAGCGGLALGFEAMGFRTVGYEMLEDACETYRKNLTGLCHCAILSEDTSYDIIPDVIIAGPPCQPFSVGGLQKGIDDKRNGFPAYLAAVRNLHPKIAIFENVRGMYYRGLPYFLEIKKSLEALGYAVESRILKAENYGVPQRRERLFVIAHKGTWDFPEAILAKPIKAGDALKKCKKPEKGKEKFLTASMDEYVRRYEEASRCVKPRDLHLDRPARTLTCRNLNGATGDMMRIRLSDGRRRRLTLQEAARLQSFPDWFQFQGQEGSQFNQIGNSVPPLLAKAVAGSVLEYLASESPDCLKHLLVNTIKA